MVNKLAVFGLLWWVPSLWSRLLIRWTAFEGLDRHSMCIVAIQWKFHIQGHAVWRRECSLHSTALLWGTVLDESWVVLMWTLKHSPSHAQANVLSTLPTSALAPKSMINRWKSLKNGYPFDLSKVCHLVDIPITSKIKRVCLNIILMFTLDTKGQSADHRPTDSDQFRRQSCHFPCLFCYQSLRCLPPQPLSAAQALLKLTIIQFRIDQWECVARQQNDQVCE